MEDKTMHEPGCDCGCEDVLEKIALVLENDEELICDVLGRFEYDGAGYIAVLPEDAEDSEDILYYRCEDSDGELGFELSNIESDEEYDAVSDLFIDLFYEDEEFDEETEGEFEEE